MNPYLLLFTLLLSYFQTIAQQSVNAYAKVTAINGNVLSLSTVDETFDSFEDGEEFIIYQVQDTVVSDTSNTTSFGQINNIQAAGSFEVLTILSHTEAAGVPTSVTFSGALSNAYNSTITGSLQIISFPELGSPNYTTTGAINGRAWDGAIGGVVAFQVANLLTLNHTVSASGLGFRAGLVSANVSRSANCIVGANIFKSASNEYGEKGEGIYKRPIANSFAYARNNLASGGGGGSHHNGGGGGGSNQTAGGEGGYGYNGSTAGCPASMSCAGLGGLNLSAHIATRRLFLGGGGGGGQQNNNVGSSGGRGGGFVFIKADSIVLTNCSGNIAITANGVQGLDGVNDGMGGGGAGGSVLLRIQGVQTAVANCTLNITTNGGRGGHALTGTAHSGGGGGGQGAIRILSPSNNNIATTSQSGAGGFNNNARDPNNAALAGGDSSSVILLSVALEKLNLNYNPTYQEAILDWQIAPLYDATTFVVQRSVNALTWEDLGEVPHQSGQRFYAFTDPFPLEGTSYYRIHYQSVAPDLSYSPLRALYITPSNTLVTLGPNPTNGFIALSCPQQAIEYLEVYTITGARLTQKIPLSYSNNRTVVELELEQLPSGIYLLHTNVGIFKLQKN